MPEDAKQESPSLGVPSWSLTVALAFVLLWILFQVLLSVVFLLLPALKQGIPLEEAAQQIQNNPGDASVAILSVGTTLLSWVATFGFIRLLLTRFHAAQIRASLVLIEPTPRSAFFVAIPVGLVLIVAATLLASILRVSEDPTPLDRLLSTPTGLAAVIVLALFIAPFAEEVFFRGFVLPPMARQFSAGTAMALNGAVFAFVHLLTYGREFGFLPPIFLMGFVMAGLRIWTGSVWPAIIAHFVFNGTSLILFFLSPETSTGT